MAMSSTTDTTTFDRRFIHLLYAPTHACSLRCAYCYLSSHDAPSVQAERDPMATLAAAIDKLEAAGVVPFTLSLHGGEVTCLPPESFEALVAYIDDY